MMMLLSYQPTSEPNPTEPPPDSLRPDSILKNPVCRRAIRESIPLFIPAIPFGFVLGAAMTRSELPTWIAWLSSITVFAGAAQLALVTSAGLASWWTAVATAVVINSRHIMYSAGLTPRFQNQPRWFRWIGPFFIIDQVFALAAARTELDRRQFRIYTMTAGLFFFSSWLAVTTAGVLLGSAVPTNWKIEMAVAVMFAGLVAMPIQKLSAVVAAAAGAGASMAFLDLPNRLGLLVGAAAGIMAAFVTDEIIDARTPDAEPGGEPA